ncbi:MAG: hypothetical protein QM658_08445, partial [Gordonia sp. (in: high G+C Gram-positive bacteria)]
LTELRLGADLSVGDVAHEADALLGTVAGWFAGQHAPTKASREMFERVLRVCGVSDDDLAAWWSAVERTGRRGGRKRPRPQSPYRGFDSFGPADRGAYFGRDELVSRLTAMVVEQGAVDDPSRGLLVVGASGVGKSSLVRAGLVPQAGAPGPLEGWRATVIVPGDDAEAALDSALAGLGDDEAPVLLVVDQLEELWTQNTLEARRRFHARLRDIPRLTPLGVLRADFYGRAAGAPQLAPIFERGQVVVPPMTVEQLREVIVRPAEVAGAVVDDDLVELMLSDLTPAGGGPPGVGVLPLLSHALRATWEQSDGRRLTVADYVRTGRISGAVEQTAEAAYESLSAGEQGVARQVLLALVNVDEEMVTRRTVRRDELGEAGSPAQQVVEAFAEARLLTVSSSHVQMAHEALLTAWPRLTGWVEADRERLLLQRRLRALAEPWDADGRPEDILPGRARLEMFAPLGDGGELDPTGRDFLAAGRARLDAQNSQERRRTRQLRRFALFAGVFGVVAAVAAVFAVAAGVNASAHRKAAERSQAETLSRQLAVQSGQLRDRDPHLAMQLAMIGYQVAPTVEARSMLIEGVSARGPAKFAGAGGSLLLSRQGPVLVAASGSGEIRVFEVSDELREVGDFWLGKPGATDVHVGGVALLPDRKTLALGGTDRLMFWDISDPEHPRRLPDLTGARGDVNALTASPDGQYLAGSAIGSGVQLWRRDGAGWRELPMPRDVAGIAGGVAFSPDGTQLATSSVTQRIDLWRVDGDIVEAAGDIPIPGRDNQVAQGLSYSPDGKNLAAALRSRSVDVFDVTNPAEPRKIREFGGFTSYATTVRFDESGQRLVSSGPDNKIRVFDMTIPDVPVRTLPTTAGASSVMFVGDRIISAVDDGQVLDWPADLSSAIVGSRPVYQAPTASSGDRVFAVDTEGESAITQWRRGPSGLRLAGPELAPPPGVVFTGALSVTPDGSTVSAGSVNGAVYFADYSDTSQPRLLGSVVAQDALVDTVDYSLKSKLAVVGGTDSHSVAVLDASNPASPQKIGSIDAGSGVWWASLAPDGRKLAFATTNGRVGLADLSDPYAPKIYPDSAKFDGAALAVRFDKSGNRLVATSELKSVKVADVSNPEHPREIATMSGPAGELYSAAFSPDGKQVVAGGGNSEIWVWRIDDDGASREAVLRSFPGLVYDVRFVDDQTIIASGAGGRIQAFDLDPGDLIKVQCARPGDQISRAEWDIYLPGVPYQPPCAE